MKKSVILLKYDFDDMYVVVDREEDNATIHRDGQEMTVEICSLANIAKNLLEVAQDAD